MSVILVAKKLFNLKCPPVRPSDTEGGYLIFSNAFLRLKSDFISEQFSGPIVSFFIEETYNLS